jgi:hypothetical protein
LLGSAVSFGIEHFLFDAEEEFVFFRLTVTFFIVWLASFCFRFLIFFAGTIEVSFRRMCVLLSLAVNMGKVTVFTVEASVAATSVLPNIRRKMTTIMGALLTMLQLLHFQRRLESNK